MSPSDEPTFGLWLHPRAPAEVSDGRPRRVHWAYYRGTGVEGYHRVATVRVSRVPLRISGSRLHRHGIVADPSRQFFGMGGPWFFYADFARTCTTCGDDFVFTARAQQFWYEELGAFCDTAATRCGDCRRSAREDRATNAAWEAALQAWDPAAPTAQAASALAVAALALLASGGGTVRVVERAIGACRRAADAEPAATDPDGWLARLEAARGREDPAMVAAERFRERTARRHDKATKALRKAVDQDLARIRRAHRIF